MKKANRGNFGTCAKCRQQILWIKTINGYASKRKADNIPGSERGKRKRENRHTER